MAGVMPGAVLGAGAAGAGHTQPVAHPRPAAAGSRHRRGAVRSRRDGAIGGLPPATAPAQPRARRRESVRGAASITRCTTTTWPSCSTKPSSTPSTSGSAQLTAPGPFTRDQIAARSNGSRLDTRMVCKRPVREHLSPPLSGDLSRRQSKRAQGHQRGHHAVGGCASGDLGVPVGALTATTASSSRTWLHRATANRNGDVSCSPQVLTFASVSVVCRPGRIL